MAKLSHWGVRQNFNIQAILQSYVTFRVQNRYTCHKEVLSEVILPSLEQIPLMDINADTTVLPRGSELRSVVLGTPFLYSPIGLSSTLVERPPKIIYIWSPGRGKWTLERRGFRAPPGPASPALVPVLQECTGRSFIRLEGELFL